jgi:hypothetical protein
MKRRTFIAGLGSTAAWPLALELLLQSFGAPIRRSVYAQHCGDCRLQIF